MSLLDSLPHKCSILRRKKGTADGLAGNRYGYELEQEDLECWEQQASASEVKDYEKRGISVSTKVFFVEDPGVTERHRILITERMGVATSNLELNVDNPDMLNVMSEPRPDASAGLGILWRVMCNRKSSATQ